MAHPPALETATNEAAAPRSRKEHRIRKAKSVDECGFADFDKRTARRSRRPKATNQDDDDRGSGESTDGATKDNPRLRKLQQQQNNNNATPKKKGGGPPLRRSNTFSDTRSKRSDSPDNKGAADNGGGPAERLSTRKERMASRSRGAKEAAEEDGEAKETDPAPAINNSKRRSRSSKPRMSRRSVSRPRDRDEKDGSSSKAQRKSLPPRRAKSFDAKRLKEDFNNNLQELVDDDKDDDKKETSSDNEATSSSTKKHETSKGKKQKKKSVKKTVSFQENKNQVETLDATHNNPQELSVKWYLDKDLKMLLQHEVRICQRSNKLSCPRGLERSLAGQSKESHTRAYVKAMLAAHAKLKSAPIAGTADAKAASQAEAMRLFSKEQTKADRQTAYKYGLQDASDVTHMKEAEGGGAKS